MITIHKLIEVGVVDEILAFLTQDPTAVNAIDQDGATPLHKVATTIGDRADIALLLLEHGANPKSKDKDGWTAYDWADFYLNADIAYLLRPLAE